MLLFFKDLEIFYQMDTKHNTCLVGSSKIYVFECLETSMRLYALTIFCILCRFTFEFVPARNHSYANKTNAS